MMLWTGEINLTVVHLCFSSQGSHQFASPTVTYNDVWLGQLYLHVPRLHEWGIPGVSSLLQHHHLDRWYPWLLQERASKKCYHVTLVMEKLCKHCLFLGLRKCEFHRSSGQFFRYNISLTGVQMDWGRFPPTSPGQFHPLSRNFNTCVCIISSAIITPCSVHSVCVHLWQVVLKKQCIYGKGCKDAILERKKESLQSTPDDILFLHFTKKKARNVALYTIMCMFII